ncbi:MAG TPA: twin-arginine translocase subunit TatC [Ignavibacteriales bacterium]|nr:twin-arginine translocase subunit TatC [Ignavibacteriales bacterium]
MKTRERLDAEENEVEMTFLDHLEELRWRLIYIVIGAVLGIIICWAFIDFIIEDILLRPALNAGLHLQNLKPFGQLMVYMQVAIIGGLILTIPNIFYHLWKFIAPALRHKEQKYALSIVLYTTFCFLAGIAFAYFVMLPLTLQFAAQFGSESIENNFSIDEYFSIVFSVMLGAGIVFELPMVSFFFSKLGLLTPGFMRKYRKHAIVVILIVAAFLSPGTDPVSQIVLTIPLVLLYEISIFISKISQKKS